MHELLSSIKKVNKISAFTVVLRGKVSTSDLLEIIEVAEDATGGTGKLFSINITEHSWKKGNGRFTIIIKMFLNFVHINFMTDTQV